MKIYAVTSEATNWLCREIFLPSIRRCEPRSDVTIVDIHVGGNGDFGSTEFKIIQLLRLKQILGWIESNMGSVILVSDIDIKYLLPFSHRMLEEIEGVALAFQREILDVAGGANMGQMLIRCSTDTLDFYKSVLDEHQATSEWEQSILNKRLATTSLTHKLISPQFANTRTGFRPDMYSFHSICTMPTEGQTSMQLKHKQFAELNNYLSQSHRLDFTGPNLPNGALPDGGHGALNG